MATLKQQLVRAKSLNPKRISNILFDSIRVKEKELIELNQKNQLLKGKDSEGKNLFNKKTKRGVYSQLTEEISGGRKKAGTPYTLEDTGDFYKGFFIDVKNDKAVFSSTDKKTPLLIAEYGEVFGLNDKNLKVVIRETLLPLLLKEIRRTLDL